MTGARMTTGLLVVVLMASGLAAQVPQRDSRPMPAATAAGPPAPTGTASIEGRVVADATGAPVGLAAVVLIGTRTGVLRIGSADSDGRFTFGALPADRYTVGASKLPYLGAVAGARRPARPGSPVVVADGAQVTDVSIRMPMGAVLSGTVYGADGQPVTGAMVAAARRQMRNGQPVLVTGSQASPGLGTSVMLTDELGRYRIHGLPPGEYIVSAMGGQHGASHEQMGVAKLSDADVDAALAGTLIPPQSRPTQPTTRPVPVYYPNTVIADDALAVPVGAGEERSGLDIQMRSVTPARITGTVSMHDGSPLPASMSVLMMTSPGTGVLRSGASMRLSPNGTFSLANQVPGRYVFLVTASGLHGVTEVDLRGVDATANIVVHPPLSLAGRIVASGTTTPPSLAGLRFQLTPLVHALSETAAPVFTSPNAAGEFQINSVFPSRYVLTGAPFFGASAASTTWGLGSVHVDGVDVTDRPFQFTRDSPPKEILLTLTEAWQDISGRITNERGAGVSDYTMLAFPMDEAYWLYESRRILSATPDADGHYRLGGPGPALLPAGDYYLAAVTDVSKDEQYDPAFLRSLVPAALRISLTPGARLTQDIRVRQ